MSSVQFKNRPPEISWATSEETSALANFRQSNRDLFQKDDRLLWRHLGIVVGLLTASTLSAIFIPFLAAKIVFTLANVFLWFSLINVTIHHHHTHHNAAKGEAAQKFLDFLFLAVIPNAPKRKSRYVRAHLNHHARPFHETDVDHHHGAERYLQMSKTLAGKILFFLELTFVGGHVPGWEDDRYLNQVPLENWNRADYEKVKAKEVRKAVQESCLQWGLLIAAFIWLPAVAWGWGLPMILVKNWAHYLGQFQHYDSRLLDPSLSAMRRTKTFRVPAWLNYLAGGEISGHFVHHLFPEIPYYNVEEARARLLADSQMAKTFVFY